MLAFHDVVSLICLVVEMLSMDSQISCPNRLMFWSLGEFLETKHLPRQCHFTLIHDQLTPRFCRSSSRESPIIQPYFTFPAYLDSWIFTAFSSCPLFAQQSLCRSAGGSKKKSSSGGSVSNKRSSGGKTSADLASILGKRKSASSTSTTDPASSSSSSTSVVDSSSSSSPSSTAPRDPNHVNGDDLQPAEIHATVSLASGSKKKSSSGSFRSSSAKRQKTKKTLNSWELPANGPVKVEDILETLQQRHQSEEDGRSSEEVPAEGKAEAQLPAEAQVLTGDEDRYLVKDVAEFAGERIENVNVIWLGMLLQCVIAFVLCVSACAPVFYRVCMSLFLCVLHWS